VAVVAVVAAAAAARVGWVAALVGSGDRRAHGAAGGVSADAGTTVATAGGGVGVSAEAAAAASDTVGRPAAGVVDGEAATLGGVAETRWGSARGELSPRHQGAVVAGVAPLVKKNHLMEGERGGGLRAAEGPTPARERQRLRGADGRGELPTVGRGPSRGGPWCS